MMPHASNPGRRKPNLHLGTAFFLVVLAAGCVRYRIDRGEPLLSAQEHLRLGTVYEQDTKFDLAERHYRDALKAGADPAVVNFMLGNVAYGRKDWGEAEARYKEALQRDPGHADAHNNLAWLYAERGIHLQQAEKHARRALELNPDSADPYRDTLKRVKKAQTESSR